MPAGPRARLAAATTLLVSLALLVPAVAAEAATPPKRVDTTSTSTGRGSWTLDDAGSVVANGDARSFGSVASKQHRPFVAIAGTPDDRGYWVAAADGAVYAFGGAHFYGSMSGRPHPRVVDVIAGGGGYVLRPADGTSHYFGPAPPPKQVEAEPPSEPSDADFDRLADCESGQRWALDTGNGYFGGVQFSLDTWHDLGYDGLPSEHGRDDQISAARQTWRKRGWSAWPACSRQQGLS